MLEAQLQAVANIPVGEHVTRGPFNVDTIWTTAIAASVVVALGLVARRRATAGVPGKVQVFWELVVGAVGDQVESSLGPKYRNVVPLGVTLFVFILACNWIEVLPGYYHNTDYLPAPTADVNLTYALGLLVFFLTLMAGIRAKGGGRATKDFFSPLHVIEHITRPLTLALRLFGNIFAGSIMIALLLSFPIGLSVKGVAFGIVSAVLTVIWKLFDMFIGVIQAFIFTLLTLLYYQFSTETETH
jgi:F-type H+-transporting ATPase subunit a